MTKIYTVTKYTGEYQGKTYEKAVMIITEGKAYPKMVSMPWKTYEQILQDYDLKTLEGRSIKNFTYRIYGEKAVIAGIEA